CVIERADAYFAVIELHDDIAAVFEPNRFAEFSGQAKAARSRDVPTQDFFGVILHSARLKILPHSIVVPLTCAPQGGLSGFGAGDLALPTPSAASSGRHTDPSENNSMAYRDILYDKRDGVATITINRPKVLNAFRAETVEEMLEAMRDADNDADIGVI